MMHWRPRLCWGSARRRVRAVHCTVFRFSSKTTSRPRTACYFARRFRFALEGSIAARDSFVVQKLRCGSAVILGKTNLRESANFRSTHCGDWSGRGGLTRKPLRARQEHQRVRLSSGAGTAANLCAAAVGSETDGSVVSPRHVNALVGIKPTVGLISRLPASSRFRSIRIRLADGTPDLPT